MPNVLIYSPNFDGHRQVHVFVYANILSELGFKLFIAGDFDASITNSYYVDILKGDNNITLKNTRGYGENGFKITNNELIELQKECNADLTIFAEADNHIQLFNSQLLSKKRKFRGKTIGLFLRPFYYYRKLGFINKLRYLKHLPSSWKSDNFLFHEYLLKRFRLLDMAFYIDENFVLHHSYSHLLPDIFQSYAEELVKEENPEQGIWVDKLNHFREINPGRFIFLYFGTAQKRRGYDLLLKMAVEYNACFVHCGLNNNNEKYEFNIKELKNALLEKGRLFETDQYISDPKCIANFFKCTSHLVLPYQDFFGSSGVMLQALGYGIPVLVPENGIMGYLVKKYNLGLTFDNNSSSTSLLERFKQFEKLPTEIFKDSIAGYMKTQTPQELKERLINAFKGL